MWNYYDASVLFHHGITNQKWGVRRYQNPDGTRTPEGKERRRTGKKYVNSDGSLTRSGKRRYKKDQRKMRRRYVVYKITENDVNNGKKMAEKFGRLGKLAWITGPQAIRNLAFYKIAEKRLETLLDKMEDRYLVSFNPDTGKYYLYEKN